MFRSLLIAGAVALAPLLVADTAHAQYVTTVAPPVAVGYVPVRSGLFGLRTNLKPVLVPGAVTTYPIAPVVTTNYLPTTTYYTPEVTTAYYAPPVTTSYYAPPVTTSYYAPTTTYYAPTSNVVPATTNIAPAPVVAPATNTYYRKTYWYSTPAPVPRTVGMPIIGY